MIVKKIIYIGLVFLIAISCKENKDSTKDSVEVESSNNCNILSLKEWSLQTSQNKDFILSNGHNTIFADDSTSVTVAWKYDLKNPDLNKDEYASYCIDLIKNIISVPEDYALKFNYFLNAYCPVENDLPIEVNSEIQDFTIIDNNSLTIYEFDIVRGRVDSGVKYLINEYKKVTDTINLKI